MDLFLKSIIFGKLIFSGQNKNSDILDIIIFLSMKKKIKKVE